MSEWTSQRLWRYKNIDKRLTGRKTSYENNRLMRVTLALHRQTCHSWSVPRTPCASYSVSATPSWIGLPTLPVDCSEKCSVRLATLRQAVCNMHRHASLRRSCVWHSAHECDHTRNATCPVGGRGLTGDYWTEVRDQEWGLFRGPQN